MLLRRHGSHCFYTTFTVDIAVFDAAVTEGPIATQSEKDKRLQALCNFCLLVGLHKLRLVRRTLLPHLLSRSFQCLFQVGRWTLVSLCSLCFGSDRRV